MMNRDFMTDIGQAIGFNLKASLEQKLVPPIQLLLRDSLAFPFKRKYRKRAKLYRTFFFLSRRFSKTGL